MDKKDNSKSIDLDEFILDYSIKIIKDKKYLYIKFPNGKIRYLCPINVSENELFHSHINACSNFLSRFNNSVINDTTNNKLAYLMTYNSKIGKKMINIDPITYYQSIYTQYVQGTTNVEGNTYTLQETHLTLNKELTISGKKIREFYEIINYRSLQHYFEENPIISLRKINIKLIKKIHSVIMNNLDDDGKGYFRNIEVFISGSEYEPTLAILIDDEMDKLIEWFYENIDNMHPIELIARFHHKIESIHPFKDGNGRVGRELVRLMLEIYGFPLITINNINREEYLNVLEKANKDEYEPIIQLFTTNLIQTHKKIIKNVSKITNIF